MFKFTVDKEFSFIMKTDDDVYINSEKDRKKPILLKNKN